MAKKTRTFVRVSPKVKARLIKEVGLTETDFVTVPVYMCRVCRETSTDTVCANGCGFDDTMEQEGENHELR